MLSKFLQKAAMSDYQGDITRGQKDRETGADTGSKNVMPATVDADDGTLLSRLIDKRPDTIQLQQQRETSLLTVDSSTFYAIMDGDERAVRGRLGGATRDLSDTALNMLVKARQKADEKEYAETVLGRMIANQQDDEDRRPGGMLSRFRWYFVFSPDVNEQIIGHDEDKKRAHKKMLDTYLGLAVGATIADNYGGAYDPINNYYYDRFGGRYSEFGYVSILGDIMLTGGGKFDRGTGILTDKTGAIHKFASYVMDVMGGSERLGEALHELSNAGRYDRNDPRVIETEHGLIDKQMIVYTGDNPNSDVVNGEKLRAQVLKRMAKRQRAEQEAAAASPDDTSAPAMASANGTAAPGGMRAMGRTLADLMQDPEFQKRANAEAGGGLPFLHDLASGYVTVKDAQNLSRIARALQEDGRKYEDLQPVEKLLFKTLSEIEDANAEKEGIENAPTLDDDKRKAAIIEINIHYGLRMRNILIELAEKENIKIDPLVMVQIMEALGAGTGMAANSVGEDYMQEYIVSDIGKDGRYASRASRDSELKKTSEAARMYDYDMLGEPQSVMQEDLDSALGGTPNYLSRLLKLSAQADEPEIAGPGNEETNSIGDTFDKAAAETRLTVDSSKIMNLVNSGNSMGHIDSSKIMNLRMDTAEEPAEEPMVKRLIKSGLNLLRP